MCGVLARQDDGSEGLRAMAAVLLRTLFDVRSNLWSRVQPHTKTAGAKNIPQTLPAPVGLGWVELVWVRSSKVGFGWVWCGLVDVLGWGGVRGGWMK